MNVKINQLEEEIAQLKKDNINIERMAENRAEKLEQYTRRNSVRVFNVEETEGERCEEKVLTIFSKHMKITLPDYAIDRCHRVGNKINREGSNRPRAIIVKFSSYKFRDVVFRNKKLLKGNPAVIKEDLTSTRRDILNHAAKKFEVRNVWTWDGVISVKTANGIRKVTSMDKLADL